MVGFLVQFAHNLVAAIINFNKIQIICVNETEIFVEGETTWAGAC